MEEHLISQYALPVVNVFELQLKFLFLSTFSTSCGAEPIQFN